MKKSTNDVTLFISVWVVKEQEPAILAAYCKKPRLGLEMSAACDPSLSGVPKPSKIVRMQARVSMAIVQKLLQRQTPEIQRHLIGIETPSIRSKHYYLVGDSIHELLKFPL